MTIANRIFTTLLCSVVATGVLLTGTPAQAHGDSVGTAFALVAPTLEGTLNINTASEKQWELLPGIGPATAKRIVSYRSKRPFKEALHLMRVKGIGRKTYEAIKPYVTVKGETTLQVAGKAKGRK